MANLNSEKGSDQRLTAAELVRKHLKDPNHVVTDEELQNVKVGSEAEVDESKEVDKLEEEIEAVPKVDSVPNPYSVLK